MYMYTYLYIYIYVRMDILYTHVSIKARKSRGEGYHAGGSERKRETDEQVMSQSTRERQYERSKERDR